MMDNFNAEGMSDKLTVENSQEASKVFKSGQVNKTIMPSIVVHPNNWKWLESDFIRMANEIKELKEELVRIKTLNGSLCFKKRRMEDVLECGAKVNYLNSSSVYDFIAKMTEYLKESK